MSPLDASNPSRFTKDPLDIHSNRVLSNSLFLLLISIELLWMNISNIMGDAKQERVKVSSRQTRAHKPWRKHLIPSFSTSLLIVCFIFVMILNGGIAPRAKRGFFCDDTSINYPANTDTIGLKTLMLFAVALPTIIIKVCDTNLKNALKNYITGDANLRDKFMKHRKKGWENGKEKESNNNSEYEQKKAIVDPILAQSSSDNMSRRVINAEPDVEFEPVMDKDFDADDVEINDSDCGDEFDLNVEHDEDVTLFTRIPLDEEKERQELERARLMRWIRCEYLHRKFTDLQIFLFGCITTMLITGISKVTTGRLRPHFLQRCQPDIDCTLPMNANRYIEDFICKNVKPGSLEMSYITTSFPSGHAAMMFYSMIYLSFHLINVMPVIAHFGSKKLKQHYDPLLLFGANVLMMALAIYISLTRVTDYHHHPTDVFTGMVVGTSTAICLFRSLSEKYFNKIRQVVC